MLRIAWSTLRVRWSSFAGTFVALAFGAALMAALGQVLASSITSPDRGPQRYAAAPVVVAPDERLTLRTPFGERGAPLAEPRGLDPELARRIPGPWWIGSSQRSSPVDHPPSAVPGLLPVRRRSG